MLRRLWGLRHFLLPQFNGRLWCIADGLRSVRIGDTHGLLQSLHRNIHANRFHIDGVWQADRGPGLQPIYRLIWRDSSGVESNRTMGTILRFPRKQIRYDTALLDRANGTIASARADLPQGGKGYAGIQCVREHATQASHSNGDMYAGHDGNVYQKYWLRLAKVQR